MTGWLSVTVLILALVLLCPSGGWAATQITKFGSYFLTQERVGRGVWHFQISRLSPDPNLPWEPSPMLTAPMSWNDPPLSGYEASISISGADSPYPVLMIAEHQAGQEPTQILEISPYAPDGQLAGISFFGSDFTNIVGLGADFRFTAVNINHIGHVVMPASPFGSILERGLKEFTSGLQAPVCYALGPGKLNGAIFINETRPLMWDFSTTPWFVGTTGPLGPQESIDFFVILGPDLPSLRRSLMNLIGRPPVPPKSVFSPWVLVPDKESFQSYNDYFASLSVHKSYFSNLTVLLNPPPAEPPLEAAAAAGLNYLVPESPYLPFDSPLFDDMEKKGFLVRYRDSQGPPLQLEYLDKTSALIDYTNPAAASYWHSLGRAEYLTKGARLFYLTGGEPEVYSSLAWYSGDTDPAVHSHYAWGQRFSLKWMEGFNSSQNFPVFRRGGPPRLFLLTRAGLAGLGRYGAGLLTEEPNIFFAMGSGQARSHLTMSGVDYYSTDISSSLKQTPFDRSKSIYEAWFAKSVLLNLPLVLPVAMMDQPWAEINLDLKNKFEPYYYSLAHQAYRFGDPIIAPLFFYFQHDLLARNSAFETMVGPYMLVAAGVNPGAEVLSFHLPAGRWFDFLGDDIIEHPVSGSISLPSKIKGLHVSPLLFRTGAIIPTIFDTHKPEAERLYHILVFPGEDPTSFTLYEDNGIDQTYTTGEFQKTDLDLTPKTAATPLKFTIKARQPAVVAGTPSSRAFIIEFIGLDNVGVAYLDGKLYDRVAKPEQFDELQTGWIFSPKGRLKFKTEELDLSKDHQIVIN
ncbi:MAG: DUF5110 domain-containing protein [Deltaproteobacteria bacterium]|nr:DUF5110 domain-containing protein [Deltaproteobacteria bacterium]